MPIENIVIDYKSKSGQLKCSASLLKLVRDKFSIINPSYQARKFQPRKYMITPSGAFQIGMWDEIHSHLLSLNIPIKLTITETFKAVYTPNIGITELATIPDRTYYDYQDITLKEFLKNGRGISILATGAGKGLIIGGLCKSILTKMPKAKILIVFTNVDLLYYSFHEEYMVPNIERWGDGNVPTGEKNILIANSQILVSDIPATLRRVKDFDVVIVDEVHKIGEKKNQISKVIHNIDTPHKFGLTGTLPDNLLSAWNVIGKIGPILYEKSSYDIRQQGNITEVEVKVVYCKHSTRPPKPDCDPSEITPTSYYEEEVKFIMHHPRRNKVIQRICELAVGNILVLVDRVQYGENLLALMQGGKKKVFFVQGSTDTDDRTAIKKLMEEENDIICIAMSTIFSTGVSINNLHSAIFAYIGKSNVKIIQSIGRTLRKHESKGKAVIYDIADNLKYSAEHFRSRATHYNNQVIDFSVKKIDL